MLRTESRPENVRLNPARDGDPGTFHMDRLRLAAFSINGQNVTGERNEAPSFNSYSAKALKSGDAGFDFTVRTAESELLAEVEFGRGLANFAVAQFLDAQSRMFEGVKFQFSTSGGQGNFKLQLGGPEKK